MRRAPISCKSYVGNHSHRVHKYSGCVKSRTHIFTALCHPLTFKSFLFHSSLVLLKPWEVRWVLWMLDLPLIAQHLDHWLLPPSHSQSTNSTDHLSPQCCFFTVWHCLVYFLTGFLTIPTPNPTPKFRSRDFCPVGFSQSINRLKLNLIGSSQATKNCSLS